MYSVLSAQSYVIQSTITLSDFSIFCIEIGIPFFQLIILTLFRFFGLISRVSKSPRFSPLQIIGAGYCVLDD